MKYSKKIVDTNFIDFQVLIYTETALIRLLYAIKDNIWHLHSLLTDRCFNPTGTNWSVIAI